MCSITSHDTQQPAYVNDARSGGVRAKAKNVAILSLQAL